MSLNLLYWLIFGLILFLGGGGLVAALLYVRRKPQPFWQNLLLSMLSLFITLLALEFYFKVFFAQPDAFGTLAMQNWYSRHYSGTFNTLGYRDQDWTPEKLAGKIKVVVVGDSLVEGVGIERPQDRFSDILGQKLGPKYAVLNIGRQGANTGDEIKLLLDYPYKPDILVWTYFINDIGDQAGPFGILLPPLRQTPPLLTPLVEHSYAFNFIYWRVYRLFEARTFPDAKWQWLVTIYNNPDAWWAHQQQLLSIYEGAHSEKIPLLVVVFPGIPYIEESQFVTSRVVNLYRDRSVPTLDVAELIKDSPVEERIASPVDQHPNELVHRLVGEALYDMFLDLKLTEKNAQIQ